MVEEAVEVKALPGDLYYYGNYSTSLVFYTERDITQLSMSSSTVAKQSAWQGKWTMPKIANEELLATMKINKKMSIIVQERYLEQFEKSVVRKEVVPVGESGELRFFAPK